MVLLGQFEKDHALFREFQDASAAESLRLAKTYAYIKVEAQGYAPVTRTVSLDKSINLGTVMLARV